VIDTPSVDWFAISPSLVGLGSAAICLLSAFSSRSGCSAVRRVRRALGFIGAGIMAMLVYIESPHGASRSQTQSRATASRPSSRSSSWARPAHGRRLLLGPRCA
jgi:hypothetical protein